MSHRKKAGLFFFLSLIVLAIGYVLTNSVKFGICVYEGLKRDPACLNFYERLGDPIFFGAGALTIITFILLFLPKSLKAWSKFAIWSLPILICIFVLYPTPSGVDYFTPRPEMVFKWLSGLYLLLSLLVIGLASSKKSK